MDPQLRDFFNDFPEFELSDASVPAIRESESSMLAMVVDLPASVTREQITIAAFNGSPAVRALLYTPVKPTAANAAYLHIHGGGLVLGAPENSDLANINICAKLGIVVVSVEYRLAPEQPYPTALFDCYSALRYLHMQAQDLSIDRARIAVGGESAGGGLAASLAIFARDKGEFAICHQQLVYPMLDSTTGIDGYPDDPRLGEHCWTRASNVYGWQAYLGGVAASDAYVPAATTELEDLPPAWIGVGDMDLFLPENQAYVTRLLQAGVHVDFNIYPGAPHGFNGVKEADVSRSFEQDFFNALSKGLKI